jgi:hypothetical protein
MYMKKIWKNVSDKKINYFYYKKLAVTRGFARKFQNVLKLCFHFHVL